MGTAWDAIEHWLATTGSMTWQVTWSLILGFTLSAIIEALVRQVDDCPPAARRPAAQPGDRDGAGRRVVVLLLRRRRPGPIAVPQGR